MTTNLLKRLPATSYLPIAPLRAALTARRTIESITDMASRWANSTSRTAKACNRTLNKYLHHAELVNEIHADEICQFVLHLHPINVFGEEW